MKLIVIKFIKLKLNPFDNLMYWRQKFIIKWKIELNKSKNKIMVKLLKLKLIFISALSKLWTDLLYRINALNLEKKLPQYIKIRKPKPLKILNEIFNPGPKIFKSKNHNIFHKLINCQIQTDKLFTTNYIKNLNLK